MKKHSYFLATQIARFGMLSIPQMKLACSNKCSQATIYRMLEDLVDQGLVKRIVFGKEAKFRFAATANLYQMVFGEDFKRITGLKESNLLHSEAVADTLLTLSRYENVAGITTELEIEPNQIHHFCNSRAPDGVIELKFDTSPIYLAVEVERSRRSHDRISEVLNKYKVTFQKNMPCSGLLVVTDDKSLRDLYRSTISKHYPSIDEQVIVVTMKELEGLDPKHFGVIQPTPRKTLESIAIWYQGVPSFSPMNSALPLLEATNKDTLAESQTESMISNVTAEETRR
ncbi:MAG: hypothetical protein JST80_02560 [Bdellovibrionales bacterium]|nr:hypothetical protein [Bdellovibrionales bacterium]